MQANQNEIIRKYRKIAHLPDFLFAFTFPLRRKAVSLLNLHPGDQVLEVGCSSGANFAYLGQAVGPTGRVVGVDLSPDMITQAQKRIQKAGWMNVEVIQASAETIQLDQKFDGLLLFAMHDVLTSPQALDNILTYIKPGGRVAAAGPLLSSGFPGKLLNPMIRMVYKRFSVSQEDKHQPWRQLAGRLTKIKVEIHGPGLMYLVVAES